MFTCQDIKTGSKYLSRHLTANDYYEKGQTVVGKWMGQGAELLGLAGKDIGHRDQAFEALRTNIDPNTGERLTPRTAAERRAFYDFQISAPKSVSILAVTFGDDRLKVAHERAVAVGYAELERLAGRQHYDENHTRSVRITGNLITAKFTHTASQELDAQLHSHLVCISATYDAAEKRWYSLENEEMFRAIQLAGRAYQAALAKEVRALGYEVVEERNEKGRIKGFQIAGVTERDCDLQSTRRAQIEAECERFKKERGREPTTRERHVIAKETRAKKLQETTTPEVIAKQRAKYTAADLARLERLIADAKKHGPLAPLAQSVQMQLEWAVDHIFERKSVATEKEILVTALQENLGAADIAELRGALQGPGQTVRVETPAAGRPQEDALRATIENLVRERDMVGLVDDNRDKFTPYAATQHLSTELPSDLRDVIAGVLANRDFATVLRGPAGAGKTTSLRAISAALSASGVPHDFITPQHMGRITLEDEGIHVETVTKYMAEARAGRRSLKGKVIVVDEAGQLSTKAGHEIIAAAHSAGARVLLVGDDKQMTSVEAGDFLSILKDHSKIAWFELTRIHRQQDPAYREAMQAMSRGDVRHGLNLLDAQRRIHEGQGDYLDRAADSYVEKTHEGKSTILVAPTWDEISQLNARVRSGRRIRGELAGTPGGRESNVQIVDRADFTAAQKRVARSYRPGMVVSPMTPRVAGLRKNAWYEVAAVDGNTLKLRNGAVIDLAKTGARLDVGERRQIPLAKGDLLLLQGTDRKLGVTNGMFATVKAIDKTGIEIETRRGQRTYTTKLPPTYLTFTHGYAVTAHKSQSATVENAIVAASRIDGRGVYVATSRGRRMVEVHVPEKERLLASAPEEITPRAAAVDYAGTGRPRILPGIRRRSPLQHVTALTRIVFRRRIRPALERMREIAEQRLQRGGRR